MKKQIFAFLGSLALLWSVGCSTPAPEKVSEDFLHEWHPVNVDGGKFPEKARKFLTFKQEPGSLKASGVEFITQNPVLLGGKNVKEIPLKEKQFAAQGKAGEYLYLLHAAARAGKLTVGEVKLNYQDGTNDTHKLKVGWGINLINRMRGTGNAVCGYYNNWGVNHNCLFVSKFKVKKTLKSFDLKVVDPQAVWLVSGAAVGADIKLREIQPQCTPGGKYESPAPLTKKELAYFSQKGTPKNIILIIGDGMGVNSLTGASLYASGKPEYLPSWQLPVRGESRTRSANSEVTDSAAGATALATGVRTNNSMVAMSPDKKVLRSISEAARAAGKATAVITNDAVTGATPSGFSAHQPKRSMRKEIAAQQLKSGLDILIGGGKAKYYTPAMLKESKVNWTLISQAKQLKGANFPVLGIFSCSRPQELGSVSLTAFNKLAAANKKGFFAMVESTKCDHGGHGNNVEASVSGALAVEFVIRAAVEFAKNNPDTLVVVTADHETGKVIVKNNLKDARRPYYYYGGTGHSNWNVPIRAIGPGAEKFKGVHDNTDIPKIFAELWNVKIGK